MIHRFRVVTAGEPRERRAFIFQPFFAKTSPAGVVFVREVPTRGIPCLRNAVFPYSLVAGGDRRSPSFKYPWNDSVEKLPLGVR